MDLFKAQLERLQRQLGGLSPSQKMLTVALVAIMVMTLVWWGRYAGEPEMESLLSGTVSAEEMQRAVAALDQGGIRYSSSGDKLMVPADQKMRAYSVLAYAKALPRGGKDSFNEILKSINPLQPESTSDKMWNRAREQALGQLIRDFPDVADAEVMIDATHVIRIGGDQEPRASVTIHTQSGVNGSQKLAEAAASLIEGAQAGLARSQIRVVINGVSVRVKDAGSDDQSGEDNRAAAHAEELKLEEKLREQFHDIPGFQVTVSVAVNSVRTDENKVTFDPKNSVSKPREEHSITEENANPSTGNVEPGAVPNAGLSVAGTGQSAAGTGGNTKEQTDTKFDNMFGKTETHTLTPAGETTPVAAAVRVPYEFFAAAYRRRHAGEVSDAVLDAFVNSQLEPIKVAVAKVVRLKESEVVINAYIDPTPLATTAAAAPSVISAALITPTRIKEVVLGVLALVSLFMVSTVVKKGAVTPVVVAAAPPVQEIPELVGEAPMGEVSALDMTLPGVEMDEEAIRAQQVMKQVSGLVKENPDSAAALVKRWLNRS